LSGKNTPRLFVWFGVGLAALVLIAAGFLAGWKQGLPIRLVSHYSLETLKGDVVTMNECAECHEGEDFHDCSTCHDEHGAIEFADLPFFNQITFTGDVPQPGFVKVNQVLPYRDHPNTHLNLLDFLEGQGVTEFESVTLISNDGGIITIEKENITEQAMLLPFSDGIRFAAEDLHVSTWLKGLTGMVVVGKDQNLTINGEDTSIGRLMLGPTRKVIVEQAKVMFASPDDGEIRGAETAFLLWGAGLTDLLNGEEYSLVTVIDENGETHEFTFEEIKFAVLISAPAGTTLVLPERARSGWITGVVKVRTE